MKGKTRKNFLISFWTYQLLQPLVPISVARYSWLLLSIGLIPLRLYSYARTCPGATIE